MDNKAHYVGPGCLQWVTWFSYWTLKELKTMDYEEVGRIATVSDEQITRYAAEWKETDIHMVVAWGFKDGCVPFPVAADVGEDEGEAIVGLTHAEVREKLRRVMLTDREFARRELQRRAESSQ